MRQYITSIAAGLFILIATPCFSQTAEQLKMLKEYQNNQKDKGTKSNITPNNEDSKDKTRTDKKESSIELPKEKSERESRLDKSILELTRPELMYDSISYEIDRIKLMRNRNKIFGHEIFNNKNITFTPSINIPTPTDYILGPSDQVFIDVWGDTQESYDLKISPDGNIVIPQIGLINLSGLTIAQAQNLISERFSRNIEGIEDGSTKIKIALGNIRSIKVDIIGEATVPGTYTLPSLASLFNAIYAAGGVNDIGSVRNIKLHRNGKEIAQLDIYDYLLNGNNKANIRLEDNDLITIEPYENIVSLTGKVKRERKYELKKGETIAHLLKYAGGMTGDAYSETVNLNRKTGRQYELFTLPQKDFETFVIKDRDSVVVGEVSKDFANKVYISGSIWRPGEYAISDNVATVGDIIALADGLKDDAYTERAQIIRITPDRTKEVIAINIKKILSGQTPDVLLYKDDSISILSADSLRQKRTISIKGELNNPLNNVEFYDNMTIEDAIMKAGGLTDAASNARLEVVRRIKNPNSTEVSERKATIFGFTIPETLALTERENGFRLQPFDELFVRRSPGYSIQSPIFIQGQCTFPGEYSLESYDERISSLVKKAGGLTPTAYVKGAHLKRRMTKDEIIKIESVMRMMNNQGRNDTLTMNSSTDTNTMVQTYSVALDLENAIKNPGGYSDLVLQEGDQLIIPTYTNTVKVTGAVYSPNAVTYNPKMKVGDYIDMAGGYSLNARKKPFVVYMNGSIAVSKGRRLKIEPGSEIVVPSKRLKDPATLSEVIGITSSSISMLALIANLFK